MFQWSSGMLSPIYCDNRILLSDHDARSAVKKAFCTMLENYQFKSVAGVATAGIAHGALVADALGLPKEFIKSAYEYRQKYQGNGLCFLSNKRSRYNSKVIVDHCTECGTRPSENSSDYLHVHHIAEQSTADETGKIHDKPFHKNITHNLMVLCEKCHQKVHHQTSGK